MKYCPLCKEELIIDFLEDRERLLCPAKECEYVHWDNPVPVVAAIVEYDGKVILANNAAWPDDKFALITGFLEQGESAEEGVLREVHEELGLIAEIEQFIGVYPFTKKNQVLIIYHVRASGEIKLNHELRAYKCVAKGELTYWDAGTGYALRDWLQSQGFNPKLRPFR